MSVRPQTRAGAPAWEDMAVSPWSRFGDDEWRLDIRTSGRRADQNRLRWVVAMPKDARIGIGACFGKSRTAIPVSRGQ